MKGIKGEAGPIAAVLRTLNNEDAVGVMPKAMGYLGLSASGRLS